MRRHIRHLLPCAQVHCEGRQALLEDARGDYVSFVDDDDMVEPDFVPAVTAAQIEFMMKLYAAGERDPEALARCASCDIDSATTLVAEFDALSGAIAASPAEPMINTYDPAQAAQPGGGKVGPVGPAPAKIV